MAFGLEYYTAGGTTISFAGETGLSFYEVLHVVIDTDLTKDYSTLLPNATEIIPIVMVNWSNGHTITVNGTTLYLVAYSNTPIEDPTQEYQTIIFIFYR